MLFLGHLVIGLIAGFILYEVCHDRNVIVFCAIGSILPDVVDKPLGHIVLNSVLDNGKIYFHSLIIFLLFLITGIVVWKYFRSSSFLCVALGVFIHQLVDMMWKKPVNWYYPLLGPYQVETHTEYILSVLRAELSSPTEWVFFIALFMIVAMAGISLYRNQPLVQPDPLKQLQQRQLYNGLVALAIFVLTLSIMIIYIWQPYEAAVL
jgi:membrane-bound metal-dependent hydrolase YbcI (DUF457 family)